MENTEFIKVSVIIPVYNSEPYLHKCLDSVINQSLKDIEIICINDGSDDDSINILRKYEECDPRIVVLDRPHTNLSLARLAGSEIAKGQYLIYWDSDDYFKENALEEMYSQCEKTNADICVCGGDQYLEDAGVEYHFPNYLRAKNLPETFNIDSEKERILTFTNVAVWNKMFKKEFLNNRGVLFSDEAYAEDIAFSIKNLCLARTVTYVDKRLIVYRRHTPKGLVSSNRSSSFKGVVDIWLRTSWFLKKNDVFPQKSFANRCLDSLLYTLNNSDSWEFFKEGYLYLQKHLSDLSIIEKDNYYDSKEYPLIVHKLYHDSPEEFLIWLKSRNYLLFSRELGIRRNHDEKNKKEVKKLKKQTEDLQKELDKKNKHLERIKNSKAYRFGNSVAYIPRKIKKLFKIK